MNRLHDRLAVGEITANGRTVGENISDAAVYNDGDIRPPDNPIYQEGALAVLKGNLAEDGAIIKPSACSERFLRHTGPALVFDDLVNPLNPTR